MRIKTSLVCCFLLLSATLFAQQEFRFQVSAGEYDRLTADGTKARWCIVEGESVPGRSGILFMSHPSNREYPEPMRVWPVDANGGRGDMYFQFCPIRHGDWVIERGKNYSQKYRMLLFDGQLTEAEAEQYWQAFAYPPGVSFE